MGRVSYLDPMKKKMHMKLPKLLKTMVSAELSRNSLPSRRIVSEHTFLQGCVINQMLYRLVSGTHLRNASYDSQSLREPIGLVNNSSGSQIWRRLVPASYGTPDGITLCFINNSVQISTGVSVQSM